MAGAAQYYGSAAGAAGLVESAFLSALTHEKSAAIPALCWQGTAAELTWKVPFFACRASGMIAPDS